MATLLNSVDRLLLLLLKLVRTKILIRQVAQGFL